MTWRSLLLPRPRALIIRLAVIAGLLPVIGWLGGGHWFLDLFNHFQFQFAGYLLLSVVALLWLKAFRAAALAAAFLIVPLVRIVPAYLPAAEVGSTGSLRVASFNVQVSNDRHDEALRWVRRDAPDIIYFAETRGPWSEVLEALRDEYPHSVDEGTDFAFYSKLPITGHEVVPCGEFDYPLLIARIQTPRGIVTFFGAHPLPPLSARRAKALDETVAILCERVAGETGRVIVAGDFNSTRWSHKSKPPRAAGLEDSSQGKAPGPTWNRRNPILGIPIDRILFRGPGMGCRRFEIGPDLGSDHRPVVAEFGM